MEISEEWQTGRVFIRIAKEEPGQVISNPQKSGGSIPTRDA